LERQRFFSAGQSGSIINHWLTPKRKILNTTLVEDLLLWAEIGEQGGMSRKWLHSVRITEITSLPFLSKPLLCFRTGY
jgi:hypothetical protein